MSNSATAALQSTGLPKVPKVLSIIANSVSCQWQDSAKIYAAQMAMTDENESKSKTIVQDSMMTDQAKSMSASLGLLRKEMSALRQMDGYLLCKLMSLQAAITEYKTQEDEIMLSESSTDLILEDDDEYLDSVEEDGPRLLVNGHVTAI